MAIIFTKQKKIQKNLIIVFVFIIIITFIIFWQGFFKKEILISPGEVSLPAQEEIEINFEIFDHPKTKEIMPFEEIQPFKEVAPTEDEAGETIGRENPFIPY